MSQIERIPVPTDEAWHAARSRDVTASVVGCLLGAHEYQTAYGLWAVKTGAVVEDPEETAAMKRGRHLEVVAVNLLREQCPTWRITHNSGAGRIYLRDPQVRLGATIDVFAEDPDRGPGVIQVKTVEANIFRRKWRDPDTGEVTPPLWIAVQGIVEAHLAKVNWVDVAPLVVSFGLDMPLVPIPLHGGVIDRVRAETAAFWRMVESGHTPDPDYGRDAEVIKAIFAEDDGTEIDLSEDNEAPALAAEDLELGRRLSEDDKRRTEVRAALIHKMGPAAAARLADGTLITAKTVHRKPYSIAASSFRQVRVKAPRGAGQPFTGEF